MVLALGYITLALQTDPIKYGIGRLINDVIVNITVYSEVKFYPVKVKLALTTSCTCIMALCTCLTNLYLRNQVHHIVALIAENALKLTNAYLYFKKFCMDEKPGSIKCWIWHPKFTKTHLWAYILSKIFRGQAPGPLFKGQGREGRRGRGKQGRGGKERGSDGRVREGASPK
jgi:hypothetical protein